MRHPVQKTTFDSKRYQCHPNSNLWCQSPTNNSQCQHLKTNININTLSTIGSSPFITTPVITSNLSSITAHIDYSSAHSNIDSTSWSFNIMQLNFKGLRDKLQEILRFMQMNNVLVAALQETKLSQLCSLTAAEYNIARKDRMLNRGGGLPFIIPFNTVWHFHLRRLLRTM